MGEIMNLIFVAVLVGVVLLSGCIYMSDMKGGITPLGQANDSQANYTNKTIDANGTINGAAGTNDTAGTNYTAGTNGTPATNLTGTINASTANATQARRRSINISAGEDAMNACDKAGGFYCADPSYCRNETIEMIGVGGTINKTEFCCTVKCKNPEEECLPYALFNFSATRLCSIKPDTKKNYYYCEPRAGKDKVAVVVMKGGIYDSPAIDSQITAYYASVEKDLSIGNPGLRKFEGKSMDELDILMDSLYLDDDVGYVILVGDDLPLANITKDDLESLTDMYDRLNIVQRNFGMLTCPDMAISYMPVPDDYSDADKAAFVTKILETYVGYHNDFATLANRYQDSVLEITDINLGITNLGYNMTIVNVYNNEYSKVLEEMKKKHRVLYLRVHGNPANVGMGLYGPRQAQTMPPDGGASYTTTLEDYSQFVDVYGTPALFVDSGACYAISIKDFGMTGFSPCCWPQIYMESGVWVYYSVSNGFDVEEDISDGSMIGLALRKNVVSQFFVYGDILAHVK